MTSQQHADLLLAQWWALWDLPPAERIKRIDEIRLDGIYAEQMQLVEHEMTLEPVGA